MRIFKWGNSLAVHLPAAVVEALRLEEGDEVEVYVTKERALDVADEHRRERALRRIVASRKELPVDWKFDRDEANAR